MDLAWMPKTCYILEILILVLEFQRLKLMKNLRRLDDQV